MAAFLLCEVTGRLRFVGRIRACKGAEFRDNSRFLAKGGRDAGRAALMLPRVAAGLFAGLFWCRFGFRTGFVKEYPHAGNAQRSASVLAR